MLASVNIANATTDTDVYTSPSTGTRSSISVTLLNRSTSPQTVNLAMCPVGATGIAADGSNFIEFGLTIPANTSYERTGLILLKGQSLWVRCSNGNVINAVVYGIEE